MDQGREGEREREKGGEREGQRVSVQVCEREREKCWRERGEFKGGIVRLCCLIKTDEG